MSFKLARAHGDTVPRVRDKATAAGSVFKPGALVVMDANGAWAECGVDPVAIGGVSQAGAGADTSIGNQLGVLGFPPGFAQAIAVQDEVEFRCRYLGTLPAANGGSFGVTKDTDGLWKTDFTKTVATRVKLTGRLTGSPENVPEVLVVFLAANVQIV